MRGGGGTRNLPVEEGREITAPSAIGSRIRGVKRGEAERRRGSMPGAGHRHRNIPRMTREVRRGRVVGNPLRSPYGRPQIVSPGVPAFSGDRLRPECAGHSRRSRWADCPVVAPDTVRPAMQKRVLRLDEVAHRAPASSQRSRPADGPRWLA